jgi:hypothetical protein
MAYWTVKWHVERGRPDFIQDGDTLGDRWNNIAGALDSNRVAYSDIFSCHLVRIVEGSSADGDPTHFYGFQEGERG